MKNVTIDGLELNEKRVAELKLWFEENACVGPEVFVDYINIIQKNITKMWCSLDDNPTLNSKMKESIDCLDIMEEHLKKLI